MDIPASTAATPAPVPPIVAAGSSVAAPASGNYFANLSTFDKANLALLVQSRNQSQALHAGIAKSAVVENKQAKLTQNLLILFGSLVLAIALLWLGRVLKVRRKYNYMIDFVQRLIDRGDYDLTSAFTLAFYAEYPNFADLLRSKILNKSFPRAVFYSLYTLPYSSQFNLENIDLAARYFDEMLTYSMEHGDADAKTIMCSWGAIASPPITECLEACPVPYILDGSEIGVAVARDAAVGLFLLSALAFIPGVGTIGAIIALSVGATLGATVGLTTSLNQNAQNQALCAELANGQICAPQAGADCAPI